MLPFFPAAALMLAIVALAAIIIVSPGFAQSTGVIKGTVADAKGQPVEGAESPSSTRRGSPGSTSSDEQAGASTSRSASRPASTR